MKKIALALAATGLMVPAAPALADHHRGHHYKQKQQRYYSTDNGIRYWQGEDGRRYCKRSDGTVGLIVGGAAGALVGRAIDTRGERATGTILGAAAGALLGRQVQRGSSSYRCR
ncbi:MULTISPECIES: glycine zipper 2TM domain-containing protein [Bacteria]|uniref:glycine zipper 2TM domain-containing protein n=1 Tax=Bacteria TaxID=2 RepID=UPI001A9CE6ED|nr:MULTISPECIES: glycine zipper 2TM domain-containing protein [Bacteria]